MRTHRIGILLVVALCLVTSACGHPAAPRTAPSGPSASPGIPPGSGQGGSGQGGAGAGPSGSSPSSSATATHGTGSGSGSGGSGSGGSTLGTSGGGSTKPADGSPKFSVRVQDQPSVITSQCPYTFTFHAKISVDKAPASVVYTWRSSEGGLAKSGAVQFVGTGPKSVTATDQVTVSGIHRQITETIVLSATSYDRQHTTTTFFLTCEPSATTPVADVAHDTCPYMTKFSSTVRLVVGPETVSAQWIMDGVPGPVDTTDYSQPGAQFGIYEQNVTVPVMGIAGRFTAALRVTGPDGYVYTTPVGTASCDLSGHT